MTYKRFNKIPLFLLVITYTTITLITGCIPTSEQETGIDESNIQNNIEHNENNNNTGMSNAENIRNLNENNVNNQTNVNEPNLCIDIECLDNQMCEINTGNCVEQINCMAILVCRTRQPEVTCFAKSVDQISTELANTLSICMEESGCEDMTCLKNECTQEFNKCKWDSSGLRNREEETEGRTYSCQGTWTCIRDCEGRMNCANSCFNRTTTQYQERIIELSECLARNGCHPDDDMCSRVSCIDEMDNCRGQLSEPHNFAEGEERK